MNNIANIHIHLCDTFIPLSHTNHTSDSGFSYQPTGHRQTAGGRGSHQTVKSVNADGYCLHGRFCGWRRRYNSYMKL